jgi:ArsR family transcriptional regulator
VRTLAGPGLFVVSIIGNFANIVKRKFDKVSVFCNIMIMNENDSARLELSAELFKAIGHPMRLAMLEKLRAGPWCVCELADSLGLNKSIASKHLSQLYDAGILGMEKRGTQVIYTLMTPCVVDMWDCSYQAVRTQRLSRLGTGGG